METLTVATPGRIILLNGSSSAGKTTLAHAFQALRPEPWFHVALDQFRDGMPPAWRGFNSPQDTPGGMGLNVVPVDSEAGRVTEIRFGQVALQMRRGMRRALAAFALAGNNVVMDDLFIEPGALQDYLQALDGLKVIFVRVYASPEVVQLRETQRSGRFPGTAMSHFHSVHKNCHYDLEIDTSNRLPEQCAALIARYLDAHSEPGAFSTMRAGISSAHKESCS